MLGTKIAVLKVKKGSKKTDPCIFCGIKHQHGTPYSGHRVAHCVGNKVKQQVTLDDGEVVFKKDGYYLEEY